MAFKVWNYLKQLFSPGKKAKPSTVASRKSFFAGLRMEPLEERRMLAIRVWSGAAGLDDDWTNAANWVGNAAPQAEDNLVFPVTAAKYNSENTFAPGTRFRSLTFVGSGYNVSGTNSISLMEGVVSNNLVGSNTMAAPLTIVPAPGQVTSIVVGNSGASMLLGKVDTGTLVNLTVDGAGNTMITDTVSGTGGIIKLGQGMLTLDGNNTYEGLTTVTQGILNVQQNNGLGSTAGHTVVTAGAALELRGSVTIPENISIAGPGVGLSFDSGALRSASGVNEITGDVHLNSAVVAVSADGASELRMSGAVVGMAANQFFKTGQGVVEFRGSKENVLRNVTTVLAGTLVLNKAGGTAIQGDLVIGDNVNADNSAVLRLAANNQFSALNFTNTTLGTVTINASGLLDLNDFNNQAGNIVISRGQVASGDIATGTGTLEIVNNLTVNAFQGSSNATPAATISGKLNWPALFSGVGGSAASHVITVNDSVLPGVNTDLLISADMTGLATTSLSRAGAGAMTLSGNNAGLNSVWILTSGLTGIGSNTALGAAGVSIRGG
ncbi:MAG: autotransporter-associated beta strand repeat-containing protein, partial [Planctomycetaceae bacterium]|nr:autotransporter-associated beta strand repeat-containing protein [Planctomycetaceae bacterium]